MSGCDRGADAVGHAFSALEPDEDRMVLEHLPVCRECRRVRDEALEIVAVLGAAVPADEPPPRLRGRVSEAVRADPAPATPVSGPPSRPVTSSPSPSSASPPPVVPSTPSASDAGRGRSWRSIAALAVAAVTLGVALIVARGALPTADGPIVDPGTVTLAERADQIVDDAEARDPQTRHATLRDRTGTPVAVVLQDTAGPRMVGLDLPAAGTTQDYVLWGTSANPDTGPVAVATMDPDDGVTRPVSAAGAGTSAPPRGYAVSVEPAGAVPARPSTVLAVGAVV